VSELEAQPQTSPAAPRAETGAPFNTLLVLMISVWALNLSLIKVALTDFPPVAFNFVRLAIASVVLLAALRRTERSLRIARRDWGRIALLAFTGYAISQTVVIIGIQQTSATNAAVISGTSPIVISLLSSFFKHDRISPVGWLGVALGFLGVYIVISGRAGGFHFSSGTVKGDALIFLAICLWAHFSVSARPFVKVYSPLKFSAVTIGLGTLFSLPFALSSLMEIPSAGISARSWGIVIFAGVVPLALGLIIWFNSVSRVGNSQTAVYSNIQPVLAIVFAHLLLNDTLSSGLLAGAAFVLAGIYLARRGRRPLPEPAPALAE